jgi:hypothetical protein
MGFSADKVDKAIKSTKGAGLQPAMDWLLTHLEDDIEQNSIGESSSSSSSSAIKVNNEDDGEIKDGEQTAQSLQCNDCQKLFKDAAAAERHALKTEHVNFSESTTAIKPLTEEEKEAKLAELKRVMVERREARKIAEQEEEINREKIRRKSGKELIEIKEKIEERELKKAMQERKKEKEQEKQAKAKIRAQIEADKKERAEKREKLQKLSKAHKEKEAETETANKIAFANAVANDYPETRLQIKTPTGAPITHTFKSSDTLENVYEFLGKQVSQPFKLMTTFPRKVLDGEDREKTLKELNLSPSAALVMNLS